MKIEANSSVFITEIVSKENYRDQFFLLLEYKNPGWLFV